MDSVPTSIDRRDANQLAIGWSDGQVLEYSTAQLRAACPCATCREKRVAQAETLPKQLPVLSLAEAQPLRIEHMRPIGNYAYNIAFSDGHDSGIFTFDLLRQLGQPSAA